MNSKPPVESAPVEAPVVAPSPPPADPYDGEPQGYDPADPYGEAPPVATSPGYDDAAPPSYSPEPQGDALVSDPGMTETFAQSHRELLGDDTIQFDLPMYAPPVQQPRPPSDGWNWLGDFLSADHPLLRAVMWGVIGLAVLLILYLIARRLYGPLSDWRRRPRAEAAAEPLIDRQVARTLLGEADELAAEGRYSEAAHLLLFRSIDDMDKKRPGLVRPALTSRELAGLPALPERPRGAFARIAALVERGFFARRDLAEGDWRECRAAYEDFAFAEGWSG